jgi:hypothetical protein
MHAVSARRAHPSASNCALDGTGRLSPGGSVDGLGAFSLGPGRTPCGRNGMPRGRDAGYGHRPRPGPMPPRRSGSWTFRVRDEPSHEPTRPARARYSIGTERRPPTGASARPWAWLARWKLETSKETKKERNTPPGVARGRTWWARPGCLENGWGKAGRAVDCVRATARVVRARLGGAILLLSRVLSPVRPCTHGCCRGDTGVTGRACVLRPMRRAGRQADRPFLRFEACSLVLHDRSVVSLEAVRRDWLARDFTFLSSSHAFFFSSVCPREIGPKSYGTCMFCIFFSSM